MVLYNWVVPKWLVLLWLLKQIGVRSVRSQALVLLTTWNCGYAKGTGGIRHRILFLKVLTPL